MDVGKVPVIRKTLMGFLALLPPRTDREMITGLTPCTPSKCQLVQQVSISSYTWFLGDKWFLGFALDSLILSLFTCRARRPHSFFILHKIQLWGTYISEKWGESYKRVVERKGEEHKKSLWSHWVVRTTDNHSDPVFFPVLSSFHGIHFPIIKYNCLFPTLVTARFFGPHMHPYLISSGHIHWQAKFKILTVSATPGMI